MKLAVMIGAGNIGRGFIGMLLEQSGYHVVFADIDQRMVNYLNEHGHYKVRMVDKQIQETVVQDLEAVSSLSPWLPEKIAEAQLVCTSVGLTALPKIAPAIARGIALRRELGLEEPLDIIACENGIGASALLEDLVLKEIGEEKWGYTQRLVGFPRCAVDRIIPPLRGEDLGTVVVERYHEWDVERGGFKGPLPQIRGMDLVERLDAYVERKLFTLNGPNAVTAYYGAYKGYATIDKALADPEISQVVYGMMDECALMLEKRWGFSSQEMDRYKELLKARFLAPYIIDDVARVAREPLRKLSPKDRLIQPMVYALGYGIATPCYYKGIALALLYRDEGDCQSMEIGRLIDQQGPGKTLEQICGISPDSDTGREILDCYRHLERGGWI